MSSTEEYRQGSVNGFLHIPLEHSSSMVLTHGAGLNCRSPLLIAIADALCAEGILVLRCNLRFRDKRPTGPPTPAGAADDRAGLREALMQLQSFSNKPLLLGGHSYGARQSTILMTEPEPPPVSALFLLRILSIHRESPNSCEQHISPPCTRRPCSYMERVTLLVRRMK